MSSERKGDDVRDVGSGNRRNNTLITIRILYVITDYNDGKQHAEPLPTQQNGNHVSYRRLFELVREHQWCVEILVTSHRFFHLILIKIADPLRPAALLPSHLCDFCREPRSLRRRPRLGELGLGMHENLNFKSMDSEVCYINAFPPFEIIV